MKLDEIPQLEGWIGITEAAEILGVSRQHGYRLAKGGTFKTLHRVGNKQILVVLRSEIDRISRQRHAEEDSMLHLSPPSV